MANGSTGTVLKIYGDINDDGQMLYVEYTCDIPTNSLYRNVMAVERRRQAGARRRAWCC